MRTEHGDFREEYLDCFEYLNKAAKDVDLRYMLVGATARDLVMQCVYGIESPRRTYDIDISILVDSWEIYDDFKNHLKQNKFVAHKSVSHKLIFTASSNLQIQLDLLPFGSISDESGDISWPPKGDFKMSILGFAEAFNHALAIETNRGVSIPVVSPEGFCLLKIVAWLDRLGNVRRKDAEDIYFVLSNYEKLGDNQHAIYEEGFAEKYDFDPDLAIAAKLGEKIRELSSERTSKFITAELFTDETEILLEELASEMSKQKERNLDLLTALKTEFLGGE